MNVRLTAASYDVIQAATGADVLTSVVNEQPDLLILDSDLPEGDGIEICKKLRRHPETSGLPIILAASGSDAKLRLRALQAGANEVLEKPISETVLLARIRNLLRARVVAQELELRQGTALELGFSEAPATFEPAGRIALIHAKPEKAEYWRQSLLGRVQGHVQIIAKEDVLDAFTQSRNAPDVIVIATNSDSSHSGITVLAELRSSPATRHSAIIVVGNQDDDRGAAQALDMGADDLLIHNCDPEEMAIRIRTQLKRKLQADRLRNTVEQGLRLAMIDPLTGLYNRRYALPHLSRIAANAEISGRPFAVMVLDLDHFKRINDTFGHTAGDQVLSEVSHRMKDNLRSVDLLARIGGEEFLIVMPETDLTAAKAAAERLRHVIAELPVELSNGVGSVPVTLSIGVSIGGMPGGSESPVQSLVDQADRALLGAKSDGRNQVTFNKSAA